MAIWDGSSLEVAESLIGARLTTTIDGFRTSLKLTEVEAYGGADDAASHAARGPTPRNRPMFGPAGTLYVYQSYGIHWCANLVTGSPGDPQAVLLRGGVPTEGTDQMEVRRGRPDHLADGPGKLTVALAIDGSFDGVHVTKLPALELVAPPERLPVSWTPRIGITKAVDRPWRCVLATKG